MLQCTCFVNVSVRYKIASSNIQIQKETCVLVCTCIGWCLPCLRLHAFHYTHGVCVSVCRASVRESTLLCLIGVRRMVVCMCCCIATSSILAVLRLLVRLLQTYQRLHAHSFNWCCIQTQTYTHTWSTTYDLLCALHVVLSFQCECECECDTTTTTCMSLLVSLIFCHLHCSVGTLSSRHIHTHSRNLRNAIAADVIHETRKTGTHLCFIRKQSWESAMSWHTVICTLLCTGTHTYTHTLLRANQTLCSQPISFTQCSHSVDVNSLLRQDWEGVSRHRIKFCVWKIADVSFPTT